MASKNDDALDEGLTLSPDTETSRALADLRIVQPRELLREQVLTKLREAIINGLYRPGDRLIERELCETLGVSRTSVREVLRLLESEQLIKVEHRRGPVVASISGEEAEGIYETRAIIETAVVRLFIERADPAAFAEITHQSNAFMQAVKDRNQPRLLSSMSAFYECLFEGAGNPVLHSVMQKLLARISFLRNMSLSESGRLEHSAAEIKELADALIARDPQRAEKAALSHIEAAKHAAVRQLGTERPKRG